MVITNVNQVVYQGDGVTTAFPFTFRIIDATDIKLLLLDSDGTETDILSDYFVDTENDTVHYPGYAPGAEPALSDRPPVLAEGQKLVIYRKLPITQEKDLGDKWPFYVIELALDKLTMILQDIWDWLGRCLYVSKGQAYEAGDDFDPTIPLEADKVICGNENGNGFDAREALMEVNGAWDGEGRQIKGVADPTDNQDAATKNYVEGYADGNFMKLQPDGTAWEGRNLPIGNVAGPALVKDAANKDYVDRILAGYSGQGDRFVFFDNVAQMQAAELVPSQMAVTLGYHDVNDGGAGVYTIRDIGADTPDGGSIIEIPGTDYVAELITDGTVNVMQFGAVGNANYTNYDDGELYENISLSSAVVAPYKDNVNLGWYANAVFTTEGIYEYRGQHFASYDSETDTYSDLAPYYDNVADKWYVTATYSNRANAWVDGVWYYGATFTTEAEDDTSAIQNALDFGKTIIFQKRNYGCTLLQINNNDTTLISNGANLVRNYRRDGNTSDYILRLLFVDNIRINGLRFDGRNQFYGINQFHHNLVIAGCNNVAIDNVISENAFGDGLYVTQANRDDDTYISRPMRNLTLRNCQFLYSCRNGMSVIACSNLVAINCDFSYTARSDGGGHSPGAGVDMEPNYDYEIVENITFESCRFTHNSGEGVTCRNFSHDVTINGCLFEDIWDYGVECSRIGVTTITNTTFKSMNKNEQWRDGADRSCIYAATQNGRLKVSNVTINDCGADGISTRGGETIIENVVIDSSGYRPLHLFDNAIAKNIKIINTYIYRSPSNYNTSIYIAGGNVILENVQIIKDVNVKSPAAPRGIKIIDSSSKRGIELRNVSFTGTFDTLIENSNRIAFASNVKDNGNKVALHALGNDGATMYNRIYAVSGASAPTEGTWQRGDRVYNYNPSAGGYEGWVCVTAGTPGTWKGFGAIEA